MVTGAGVTEIFGVSHTPASLAERSGTLAQFGGVRLSTLEDGAGRGTRVLDFNTGSGLHFTVNLELRIHSAHHLDRR